MWCTSKIRCLFDVESYKFAYVVFLCLILVKPRRKLLLVVLELGTKLTRKTFYNYDRLKDMKNPFSLFKVGAKVILMKYSLQQTFWNLNGFRKEKS
jgi:hypothetical protein